MDRSIELLKLRSQQQRTMTTTNDLYRVVKQKLGIEFGHVQTIPSVGLLIEILEQGFFQQWIHHHSLISAPLFVSLQSLIRSWWIFDPRGDSFCQNWIILEDFVLDL